MYEDPEFLIIMGRVPSTLLGNYIKGSAKAVASLKVVLIIVVIALSVKGKNANHVILAKLHLAVHM